MAKKCGCGAGHRADEGCGYALPLNVSLTSERVDPATLGRGHRVDPCAEIIAVKAVISQRSIERCEDDGPNWLKILGIALAVILALILLIFALKGIMGGGGGWASTTSSTPAVAQAGQPVSASATTGDTYVFVGGNPVPGVVQKTPSGAPAKAVAPKPCPCKAVVFDPSTKGTMRTFGVELAVDGANYIVSQTSGELASPNDIAAAQAARPNGWVMVVYDPSGPYAITSKGTSIPVRVDNTGRILVSADQVQIGSSRGSSGPPKTLPGTPFGVVPGFFLILIRLIVNKNRS